jgi:hypothetical protein
VIAPIKLPSKKAPKPPAVPVVLEAVGVDQPLSDRTIELLAALLITAAERDEPEIHHQENR